MALLGIEGAHMKQTISTRILTAMALIGLAATPVFASPSNKWRIEVSESAKSDGEIIFYMTPEGSEPIEIRVAIDDGTGETKVARKIHAAFQKALPGKQYNVEVDDGEDVLVKKRADGAKFDLALVTSSVKSVRIKLDRE
jgi:ABC-type glycerol-3-phosphate transport system substrate-binding protein